MTTWRPEVLSNFGSNSFCNSRSQDRRMKFILNWFESILQLYWPTVFEVEVMAWVTAWIFQYQNMYHFSSTTIETRRLNQTLHSMGCWYSRPSPTLCFSPSWPSQRHHHRGRHPGHHRGHHRGQPRSHHRGHHREQPRSPWTAPWNQRSHQHGRHRGITVENSNSPLLVGIFGQYKLFCFWNFPFTTHTR